MNRSLRTQFARSASLIFLTAALAIFAVAQGHSDEREIAKAGKQITEASKVLERMMNKPDSLIPQDLLERADAIAVFPRVVTGAFIKSGPGGDGIVVRRLENGWSMPVFYKIGGASASPPVGAKKLDYIVLFMNEDGLEYLQEERFEFGGNVSFAAGPVGQTAGSGTDDGPPAEVLTWSRSKGAFVAVSIEGAAITPDNDRNLAVYGMTARDLITSETIVCKRAAATAANGYSWRSTRD
jgi:lipid-binding SYLF domain-containing protein